MDFLFKVLDFSLVQLANWIGVIDNYSIKKSKRAQLSKVVQKLKVQ